MLTTTAIKKKAEEERDRLRMSSKWAVAYADATPGEPLHVGGDGPDDDYYLVEFRQDHRTSGLMEFDASTGELSSFTGIEEPGTSLYRFYRPEEIPALVAQQSDLFAHAGHVSTADISVQPALFWVACDQSVTPFQPFYVVKVPGMTNLYVRVDGEIYTSITHGGAGL